MMGFNFKCEINTIYVCVCVWLKIILYNIFNNFMHKLKSNNTELSICGVLLTL